MRRLRWIAGTAALLALVAAAAWAFRAELAARLYALGVERQLGVASLMDESDGLHILFCGTGSPLPDPARAGPCTAVLVGTGGSQRIFLVDAGESAGRQLQLMGVSPGRLTAVLLTHLHSDHIDGLGALALQHWVAASARAPLPLIGPEGTASVAAGFNEAYRLDRGFRIAHHGEEVVPASGGGLAPRPFALAGETAVVLDDGGLRITAIRVPHDPVEPAVGYRFDYRGRCVTISGDTAASPALARAARDCDLLVHEALQPRLTRVVGRAAEAAGNRSLAKVMADIESYHTAPEDAAEVAAAAGVASLAFTHLIPPLRAPGIEAAFLGDARRRFDGRIDVMADGDVIHLPAEGGERRSTVGR